jgi:hypothetical protein
MSDIILGSLGFAACIAILYLIEVVGTGGLPKHPNNKE